MSTRTILLSKKINIVGTVVVMHSHLREILSAFKAQQRKKNKD
jgi:hypothetical protein